MAVAFSGGVDSAFLLAEAREALGERVVAVTASSPVNPMRELDAARDFCAARGIVQTVVAFDALSVDGFSENPADRCYLCKRALLALVEAEAGRALRSRGDLGPDEAFFLVEGSNASDRDDYRPGAAAVAEAGVRSPLDEAGLTKQDIRDLSREAGLPTWNKPSFACLATRFACGEAITAELLERVGTAEQLMVDEGFAQVRVRVGDGGRTARVEVAGDQLERALHVLSCHGVSGKMHDLGFAHVSLDVDGYRTGSMNA